MQSSVQCLVQTLVRFSLLEATPSSRDNFDTVSFQTSDKSVPKVKRLLGETRCEYIDVRTTRHRIHLVGHRGQGVKPRGSPNRKIGPRLKEGGQGHAQEAVGREEEEKMKLTSHGYRQIPLEPVDEDGAPPGDIDDDIDKRIVIKFSDHGSPDLTSAVERTKGYQCLTSTTVSV